MRNLDVLVNSGHVIPAKAGIYLVVLDSCLRRNDGRSYVESNKRFSSFLGGGKAPMKNCYGNSGHVIPAKAGIYLRTQHGTPMAARRVGARPRPYGGKSCHPQPHGGNYLVVLGILTI
jgi:hypothetical protein